MIFKWHKEMIVEDILSFFFFFFFLNIKKEKTGKGICRNLFCPSFVSNKVSSHKLQKKRKKEASS
jgi:hypothetical protein